MKGFIGDILRSAWVLILVVVAGIVFVVGLRADAERINGLLAAAEYELVEPPPVTENLLAYQSQTGMIGEEDGRPWKSLIALAIVSLSLCGGMVGFLLIGPEGLNGFVRQLRLLWRNRPSRRAAAPQPELPKIKTITPASFPIPLQPERQALPGGNKWLLPPGE